MANFMNFESSRDIERKRQEVREARHVILEKTKEKYDKDERRKELAKQRGEDTWMLPSISNRVDKEEQSMKNVKKKKKDKKKKKHKEKEKKKKRKKRDSSSSSESSSDDEDGSMWVEKSTKEKTAETLPTGVKGPRLERDSWMNAPVDLFPTVTRQDLIAKKNKEKEEMEKEKEFLSRPGQHAKELNPYWKDGGTGIPEESKSRVKDVSNVTGTGDSGLSWLRKSYQRCVEQAKEEGRNLEEMAAERWGSLEKIQKMISEAEMMTGHGQGQRGERSNERSDRRDRFMKPGSDNKHMDRRKKSRSHSRSPVRSSGSRNGRNRSRTPERHRYSRSNSREKSERSRDRDRRSRSREKYRKKRSRSRSKDRTRRRTKSRSRERYRKRSRSKDRSSASSSMKSMFMKPGEMDDNSYKSSRSVKSSSDRIPSWKKKEFQKPVETEERDKRDAGEKRKEGNRDADKDRSRRRRQSSSSESSSSGSSSEESSSSSEEEPSKGQSSRPQEPEVKLLTEKEMNALGAKIVKAEIMGNQEQADKLKSQLEAAREARKNAPPGSVSEGGKKGGMGPDEDFVTLTRTDRSGMARPVPDAQHPLESRGGKRRKKQKVETHTGKQGERTKYFDDDDKFDLKTLVEREKLGTAEDQNKMFARLAGRAVEKTNDDFQVDDIFISKANQKQSESIEEQRERSQAIFEHRKMATALEKCNFCFGNVPKHLIVALGTKVYLCLPNNKSLTEGHCLIVPMQHVAASTTVDEDVWSEMQVFRKCLTKMFADRDEDVVFMETSMRLKQFPHMCIECVPMDKEVGDLAPIYFKKAIQESESEWSQNKKVVDLSQKDIRHAVPKGFPYFSVDFGNQGGFAHVIEDELKFPHYFGKEIIGGMIDAEHRLWRKPPRENFDDQRKKVLKFAEMWKPHDWTQNISKKVADSSDSDSD